MRVIRDVAYVKKRKRAATYTSIFGVALLAAAFWLSFSAGNDSRAVLIAYLPLLAGTVIFHLGMQQVAQWNRTPRNDQVLDHLLRGLGERYVLIHFAPAGKRVVQHVLVHPGGLLAVVMRELDGKITHQNDRWRRGRSGFGRLFGLGGPQLGNPSYDATAEVGALQALVAEQGLAIECDAVIAFVNPRVELAIEEPDFPVVNAEGLEPYVRSLPADPAFTPADRQAVVALLAQGEVVEDAKPATSRRPVKRRAA
jgi:hypothetical protein